MWLPVETRRLRVGFDDVGVIVFSVRLRPHRRALYRLRSRCVASIGVLFLEDVIVGHDSDETLFGSVISMS